jgi:cytochrome d ubiquinol oxidase subunit I
LEITALGLARTQFAVTTLFHMLWPLLSIGLSLLMVVLEIMWQRTGNALYYRQVRFWSKIFLITFGIGVASGVPLEFQFGTNWSRFSASAGSLFGSVLAFEASMAFALEAAFLAVFIFGWDRVGKRMHLFSNVMVALGASLSAFWIMSANSWMQSPAGVVVQGGTIVITDYLKAVFNPDFPLAFIHMWVAAIETTLFFVAGVSAWYILRKRQVDFFLKSFKIMVIMGIVVAPLQVIVGDQYGLELLREQPAKAAAMEAHWVTNPPDTSASWVAIGWPNQQAQKNDWEITVPYMLSILDTHSLKSSVTGLKDFPVDEQPPVAPPFFAFRIMVVLGLLMVGLVLWALIMWWKKKLSEEAAPKFPIFWNCWLWALPVGFIATECGWIVREVGRQPWIIYHILRTSDGVSSIGIATAAASLILFIVIYMILLGLFIYFTRRILMQGPDLTSSLPVHKVKKNPGMR